MKYLLIILVTFTLSQSIAQDFVKSKKTNAGAYDSEEYLSLTFNGSWCWFSDPRAVFYEGKYKRTYTGWTDNYGDIHISYFDHETGEIQSTILYNNLEIDDHNNPSILFDEEGKLIVFFNAHMLGVRPLYMVKSTSPEDISNWTEVTELFLNDKSLESQGSLNHTYTNPIKLSSENGKIYLFWRGVDGKPSYSVSENNGETWSTGKILFMPEALYKNRRPYTKVYSDGKSRIHFTFTDGHPRNESTNSIYYMYYESGSFYKADGTKIKNIEDGPVYPGELDKVYDAEKGKAKSWNWDIAQDENGYPVIAYVKFPNDQTHIYSYARYSEGKWNNYDLVNSGGWFPETPEGVKEPEPNYSGGMNIDHENPDILYLSVQRDSIFEIEKWETKNQGKSWKITPITSGSSKNNIRPFAVRNAREGNPLQVLWMQNTKYLYFAHDHGWDYMSNTLKKSLRERFHSSIKTNLKSPKVNNPLEPGEIKQIMRKTADWQLSNPIYSAPELDWVYGAFYTGIRALYELTGEHRYINELVNIGEAYRWQPMNHVFHADRLTVIDNWAWLYSIYDRHEMIDKSKWVADMHLSRDYKNLTDVRFEENPYRLEWWTWCDALFMAPPSFVQLWKVTGNERYLSYMDTQWWKTSDYLYSKTDSLYYRDDRFFDDLSKNGKKIFWARGNGWVIAGLARILDKLPEDYENRSLFENQYREMAHKLLSIQGEDGLWRVSLHDPEFLDLGESSGSSFFTFALAWGINNGLLDEKYRPQVEKAWKALVNNVNDSGRLGYVQQIAGDPYPFTEDQFQAYATGAFLLAGKEIHQMISR